MSKSNPSNSVGVPPTPDDAMRFLKFWHGGGRIPIVHIVPDGPIGVDVIDIDDATRALTQIAARSKSRNVYYHVNRASDVPAERIRKKDISTIIGFHVDIDPDKKKPLDEERRSISERVKSFRPKPSVVIDTGGGYQLLFKLRVAIGLGKRETTADEIEAINRGLAHALGGDRSTTNVDRLFRPPGTWNHPTKTKRVAGRILAPARLIEIDETALYDIEDFLGFAKPKSANVTPLRPPIDGTKGTNELQLSDQYLKLIKTGECDHKYPSRSEALLAVVCELVRKGASNAAIEEIILDPENLISESVLAKGAGAPAYARRQAERARKLVVADFIRTEAGAIDGRRIENLRLAIERLGVELRLNEHDGQFEVVGLDGFGPNLDDGAADRLFFEIESRFRIKLSVDVFSRALHDIARSNRHHPLRDLLTTLKWDGVPRVVTALSTYFGVIDNAYTQEVAQVFFVGAVRRVMRPGVKFDETVVLEGPQGAGKSEALRILALNDRWFSDDFPLRGDGKEVIEATEGKWIIEIAELAGMTKAAVEHVKALQSRTKDRARRPYARYAVDVPRQSVFVGTTNESHYLRDLTGNRRFLPVRVTAIDLEALKRDREQLWAEAVQLEKSRKVIGLPKVLWAMAAEEQSRRVIEDPWYELLDAAFAGDSNIKVSSSEVWQVLGLRQGEQKQADNKLVGHAMRRLGFEKTRFRDGGHSPVHGYVRGDNATAQRWKPQQVEEIDEEPI